MGLIVKAPSKTGKGKFIDNVKLFTDGACKGNPGPGGIGIVIIDNDGTELWRCNECIGDCTNNIAEYQAIITGLNHCAKFTRKKVTCFSDSQLVVRHMNGIYRIKAPHLLKLFKIVKQAETPFEEVIYTHVNRENPFIQKADRLANEALQGR